MTVTITPIYLKNMADNSVEEGQLWDAITEKNLADWEGEWIPELFKATQRLHRANVERTYWPQSRHWNWRRKANELNGMLGNPGFSVMCGGLTQGMMFVETSMRRCRVPTQKGMDLVYIEFLENAPWNRAELLFDPPRYRGVGSILIRAAIELSKNEEFQGRIGLHSLPQANSFYANTCGMIDCGVDPNHDGLRYFEMTREIAAAFIQKGAPNEGRNHA